MQPQHPPSVCNLNRRRNTLLRSLPPRDYQRRQTPRRSPIKNKLSLISRCRRRRQLGSLRAGLTRRSSSTASYDSDVYRRFNLKIIHPFRISRARDLLLWWTPRISHTRETRGRLFSFSFLLQIWFRTTLLSALLCVSFFILFGCCFHIF